MDSGLLAVIEAAGGTRTALARVLNVNRQAIHAWKQIPITRVLQIEKLLGVPREVQRPDYYAKANHNHGRRRKTA